MTTDWHWEDVKSAIRKRGTDLSALSIELGFKSSAVRQIKFSSFPRAQAGVARFLGLQPQDIWPSRYDAAGRPIRKQRRDIGKTKPPRRPAEPQKVKAV